MAIILCLTSLVLFAAFTLTACPTVFLGDSGEIITAAYKLGVCHPPGYPIYMLLSKVFTFMPAGDIAFRVNLLAAFLGALTFAPVFLLCREILYHTGAEQEKRTVINTAAFVSALAYVLHSQFWQLCTQAKGGIYVLAVLLSALSLYAALRFLRAGKMKYLYLSMYLAGFLPFIHQSASAYALISAGICAFASRHNRRGLVTAAGFLLFSFLTANLYLFIRNAASSDIAWNGVAGFSGILSHIFRKAYAASGRPDFVPAVYARRLWIFITGLAGSFHVMLLFFALGAAYAAGKKTLAQVLAPAYVLLVIVFLAASNNFSGFEQNSLSANSMLIASQMYPVVNLAFIMTACCGLRAFMAKAKPAVIYGLSALIAAGFIVIGAVTADNSQKFLGYDHAMNILKSVDYDNPVFTEEDTYIFNLLYVIKTTARYSSFSAHDMQANILNRDFYGAAAADNKKRNYRLMLMRMAELNAMRGAGKTVYYTAYKDFIKDGFECEPRGILFRMQPLGRGYRETGLFSMYSFRDFFRCRNLNIQYREISARYPLMRGWEALSAGKKEPAQKWLAASEAAAPGSVTIMSLIASAYLYAANDKKDAVIYMRKALDLDPYSREVLRQLIVLEGLKVK